MVAPDTALVTGWPLGGHTPIWSPGGVRCQDSPEQAGSLLPGSPGCEPSTHHTIQPRRAVGLAAPQAQRVLRVSWYKKVTNNAIFACLGGFSISGLSGFRI